MNCRLAMMLLLVLLTASCGRGGQGPFAGLIGQSEAAPPTAPAAVDPEADPDADPGADPAPNEVAALLDPGDPVDAVDPAAPVEAAPPAPPAEIDPANLDALDSDRVICEEKGGRWSRALGGFVCVWTTRDGNRACSNASQCEGYCLARSRTCAPVRPLFGCHDVLSRGGVKQTVCVD